MFEYKDLVLFAQVYRVPINRILLLDQVYKEDGGIFAIMELVDELPTAKSKRDFISFLYQVYCQYKNIHPGSHLSSNVSFELLGPCIQEVLSSKRPGMHVQSTSTTNFINLYKPRTLTKTMPDGKMEPIKNGSLSSLFECSPLPEFADDIKSRPACLENVYLSRNLQTASKSPLIHINMFHCAGKVSSADRNSVSGGRISNLIFESTTEKIKHFASEELNKDTIGNFLLNQPVLSGTNSDLFCVNISHGSESI